VVEVFSVDERVDWFGGNVGQKLPSIMWDRDLPYWRSFNGRAIEAVRERIQPGDFVAIMGGSVQQEVVDAFKDDYTVIEPAVGYEGLAQGTFACFESYAWMHNRYGAHGINDGRSFDAVIPNFLDPYDFRIGETQGYALFMGRLIQRKGPHVAADIARLTGLDLIVAGAGVAQQTNNMLVAEDGTAIGPCIYAGVVDPFQRRDLLANAALLIVPTLYIEPFGTVHAEALMSGTPVLTPDYGVFTETVRHGIDGFRYRTLGEAADFAKAISVDWWDRQAIRSAANERFSLQAVAPKFDRWLWNLESLRDGSGGWYAMGRSR
jgi:glycosyltransferase involved in cell wall biosynthesis